MSNNNKVFNLHIETGAKLSTLKEAFNLGVQAASDRARKSFSSSVNINMNIIGIAVSDEILKEKVL